MRCSRAFTSSASRSFSARLLLRIAGPAFVVLAVSGTLLFVPSADRYAVSPVFFLKLGAIAVGALNALAFHLMAWQRVDAWSRRPRPPWTVRAAAIVSVLVWVSVIALGRGMGYESRRPPAADLDAFPAFD
jgi:membrane protein required for beta-lactamase induction